MMPLHPAEKDVGISYEEDRQLVLLADRLNYKEAWMGEHYSSTAEPVTSPLIFNASLISETKKIKFGSGVISLPQQHPAVVAGQVYVGTGYRAMAESMNRWFEETIDIMTIPHTGPGEYYDLDPRKMEPMEMERWGMPIIQ